MDRQLEELRKRKLQALEPGTEEAVARRQDRGKLSARERIDYLVDDGSFQETGMFVEHRSTAPRMQAQRPATDGVVTGLGTIDGREVFVYSQDSTLFGGSVGEAGGEKIAAVLDQALAAGVPVVGINDGGGARIYEGVNALAAYGSIFYRNVAASGVVPQISVMMGLSTGGASYSPALTDFTFMVEGLAAMAVTGPGVVRASTGELVTHEDLGGAGVHATKSGLAQITAPDERSCLDAVRRLLGFLPQNHEERPPRSASDDPERLVPELVDLLPDDINAPYDVLRLLDRIVDHGDLMEYSPRWAPNIVCGFARLDGWPVGVVANQPAVGAGVLDLAASQKAARFVRTCDAFGLPLLSVVDVPGFMPGKDQEHGGIARHGAKLLYAFCEATVPRIQLVTRKAYGGAWLAMGPKATGADLVFAWPSAQIAAMGTAGAVDVLHGRELASSTEPEQRRAELIDEYEQRFANPYDAARRGYVDDVIEPQDTRRTIIRSLRPFLGKERPKIPRKHDNIPF